MPAAKPIEQNEQSGELYLETYAPFHVTRIANRWTATASRHHRQFGIGVAEWGVLAGLKSFGDATSLEVANRIEMDAAAVSRAVTRLLENGHVVAKEGRFKGRSKPVMLTESGDVLFHRIATYALSLEDRLLSSLTETERHTLVGLLKKVHDGLDELQMT